MKVLSVANQKGGVGKTTTAVTLASAFAQLGKKVLLIDLDPHSCASVHMRIYPEEQKFSIYDLFIYPPAKLEELWPQLVIECGNIAKFEVISASVRLSDLEVDINDRPGKGGILSRALRKMATDYDIVIIDCPPHTSVLLVNALIASDLVVIPVQTDFLALHGLKLLFETISTINKVLKSPVDYRTIATMYDKRAGACQRVLSLMRSKMGGMMLETVIGVDTRFREASAQGKVIYELGNSRGGVEYLSAAKELLEILSK